MSTRERPGEVSDSPGQPAPERPRAGGEEAWGWTRGQRIGLAILAALLLACLAVQWVRRPSMLEPAAREDPAFTLPAKVDPNTATAAELARLPHLGDAMAQRIIEYREARRATAQGGIVFRRAEDLDNVPRIGPKLLEEYKPFLKFPDDP